MFQMRNTNIDEDGGDYYDNNDCKRALTLEPSTTPPVILVPAAIPLY